MTIVHKIVNIILSVVFLFATMGITINKHYCGGKLQDAALFISANQCNTDGSKEIRRERSINNSCKMTDTINKNDCCENQTDYFKANKFISNLNSAKVLPGFQIIPIVFSIIFDLFVPETGNLTKFFNYKPPLLHRDISVFFQSFLI